MSLRETDHLEDPARPPPLAGERRRVAEPVTSGPGDATPCAET
jgi:hypothetical protein